MKGTTRRRGIMRKSSNLCKRTLCKENADHSFPIVISNSLTNGDRILIEAIALARTKHGESFVGSTTRSQSQVTPGSGDGKKKSRLPHQAH